MYLTTLPTAKSIPFLRFVTLTLGYSIITSIPSTRIACANTVAVVVPSPATSAVLDATSLTNSAAMFSIRSCSLIALATVTPSLVMIGGP